MAKTIDPMEKATDMLELRLKQEDRCKRTSASCVNCGTHKQAVAVAHKATQRSVEYYQARITMLANGGYRALTSSDRAALKDMRPVNNDRQERRAAAKIRLAAIKSRRSAGDGARQLVIFCLAAEIAKDADLFDAACVLADWNETHAPTAAIATVRAFQDAPNRTELLTRWESSDWPKIGLLWLGGLKTPAVKLAMGRILA